MSQEHRFFVESASPGETVPLSSRDHHHASTVLRLKVGAQVTVVSRTTQRLFSGVVQRVLHDQTEILVIEELKNSHSSPNNDTSRAEPDQRPSNNLALTKIHLVVGLPKGDLPEWIAEKATELGAQSITFFQADRSVVKLKSSSDAQKKQLRLARVVEDAAKQCKRLSIPTTVVAEGLETALHSLPSPINLCACLQGTDIPDALQVCARLDPNIPIGLVIGPEGDFSPPEKQYLRKLGAKPVSLGQLTLRVETAALCVLAHFNLALSCRS